MELGGARCHHTIQISLQFRLMNCWFWNFPFCVLLPRWPWSLGYCKVKLCVGKSCSPVGLVRWAPLGQWILTSFVKLFPFGEHPLHWGDGVSGLGTDSILLAFGEAMWPSLASWNGPPFSWSLHLFRSQWVIQAGANQNQVKDFCQTYKEGISESTRWGLDAVEGCLGPCRVFSSISGLYLLDASSFPHATP